MWKHILITCVLLHLTVKADDELFENELSSDILQEIRKRLDLPPKQCQLTRNSSTIIRTNESLSAGAQFLVSRKVASESGCQRACCKIKECNLAIFEANENKFEDGGDNLCYLFNCGYPNKCKFTYHKRYTTSLMKNLAKPKQSHPANDLKDLSDSLLNIPSYDKPEYESEYEGDNPDNLEPEEEHVPPVASKTTTTTTTKRVTTTQATTTEAATTTKTTTTTTTVAPTEAPRVVEMLHHCRPQDTCAGSRTACVDGFCRCEAGYHPKNGICRQNCKPDVEFECTNGMASIKGPDCIAIYDTCDGIAQCTDGSDEMFCDKETETPQEEETNAKSTDVSHPKASDMPSNEKEQNVKQETKPPTVQEVEAEKSTLAPHEEESDHKEEEEEVDSKLPLTSSTSTTTTSTTTTTTVKPAVNELTDNIDKEAKSSSSDSDSEAQGAVIALSLGLAVTALLLLFVGCRYRNMKRKIRRGRPLDSNEADYLINGMYL